MDDPPPLRSGVNEKRGERFLRGDDLEPVLRDPLAIAMLSAWIGVPPDKFPDAMKAHTCTDTMIRWKRCGEAALAYFEADLSSTPNTRAAGQTPKSE